MARPPLTQAQKNEIKNSIRRAALRLKAKHDSEQITVRDVASEAGVSVGTFYSHYESLSELAQSTWREPVDRLRGRIEKIARRTEDPLLRIEKVLLCYAQFEKRNRAAFKGVFLHVRPQTADTPEKQGLQTELFFRILSEAVEDGQESGRIRQGNPFEIAQLLWASIHGAMALPHNLELYRFPGSQALSKKMVTFLIESLSTVETDARQP